MVQFVSFVNGVSQEKEVAFTVNYQVLLIPMLPRFSMQTLVGLIELMLIEYNFEYQFLINAFHSKF